MEPSPTETTAVLPTRTASLVPTMDAIATDVATGRRRMPVPNGL